MRHGSIVVGAVAAVGLWVTGLGGALSQEKGVKEMELVQVEGYALNTPMYTVADIDRSIAFYTGALGLTLANHLKDDNGVAFHAEFQSGGLTILMVGLEVDPDAPDGSSGGPHGVSPNTGGYKASFNGYFYVADVDAFYARATAAGAEAVEGPTNQFWGDRTAYIKDPDGYLWMIASKIAEE